MTLQFAAQKNKFDLQEITAVTTLDFEENQDEPGEEIPHYRVQVSLKGNLTAEQIARLKRVSVKCEAYKLLTDTNKKVTIELQPAS